MSVIVIAEAGVNHNGSLDIARKLVTAAAKAGADIVKFQTFKADKIASRTAKKAAYQQANMNGGGDDQLTMLRKLEMDAQMHTDLMDACEKEHIAFLSTPFDHASIDLLSGYGIKTGKIPSGELTNLPYLEKMAKTFQDIILSTGMATLREVEDAVNVLYKNGTTLEHLTILHCTTEYPTPMIDVNLRAMETLQRHFGTRVGYSDHTPGIEIATAAVAMGATLIEKHFTLDRNMEGPDHKASLQPEELTAMISAIRNIEVALGNGVKSPSESEQKNIPVARKSIVAARAIKKGELFSTENLTVKRPGNGISPMNWYSVLGLAATKDFMEDDLIEI